MALPLGRWQAFFPLALAAITCAGGLLRCYQAGESLWVDELHTAWSAAGPIGEVAPRAMQGNQSPAWFYLPWLSTRLLGMNEPALRLPSLAAGIALIPSLGLIVLWWSDSRAAALLAAGLAAIDADALFFSQEARPYATMLLLAVWNVFFFSKALSLSNPHEDASSEAAKSQLPASSLARGPGMRWQAAFVLSGAAMLYMHYTAAQLVVAEAACYLALWRVYRRQIGLSPLHFFVNLLAIGLLAAPLVPHVLSIGQVRDQWWPIIEAPTAAQLLTTFPFWQYLLVPGAFVLAAAGLRYAVRKRPFIASAETPKLALALYWFFVPLAAVWLVTAVGLAPLFLKRYFLVAMPGLIILSAMICSLLPARWPRGFCAAAVVLVAFLTGRPLLEMQIYGRPAADRNEEWQGAVALINDRDPTGKLPVLLYPVIVEDAALARPHDERLEEYCLFPLTGPYRLVNEENRLLVPRPAAVYAPLPDDMIEKIARQEGAWLIVRAPPDGAAPAIEQLSAELEAANRTVEYHVYGQFGAVTVVRFWVDSGRAISR